MDGRRIEGFECIKELVTTAPYLALVDLADAKLVLQVNTDASKVAVGSVLLHVDESGNHPISYFSRKLSEME